MPYHPSSALLRAKKAINQKVFRGEIHENHAGNAHLKEFLACHFHRKIMRDAKLSTTRRQGLRAANQIGKTRIGECIMIYRMEHDPAHTVVYDETIEKSRDHMSNRFGPLLKSIPSFGKIFKDIMANNRFDVTTQDIRLPGMIFRARPLNEQWTQSITVRYGLISDAALCDPRQVRRAFVRSRQHEKDDFWFVESQGDAMNGQTGGGFKEFMATTNDAKLWVRCPLCQTRQRFIFHHERTQDTQIVAPLSVASLDRDAWISHNKPILLSEERRHAGFKVEGELKKDDGSINEQQIMRATVYECPHCGGIWRDDGLFGETRRYLDREAGMDENWIATRPDALPGYLGYSLPVWINPIISWGSAMLFFRQAMEAKKMGNLSNLQEFRTKWEGEDWDCSGIGFRDQTPAPGSYDPLQLKELIANAHSLDMTVDCQEDGDHKQKTGVSVTGWFWVIVRVWGKDSNSKQTTRFFCKSWDYWISVQKYWNIPNDRVMIDCLFDPVGVRNKAVEQRKIIKLNKPHPIFKTLEKTVTWKLLQAVTRQQNWKHKDGKERPWSEEQRDGGYVINPKTGRPEWITVPKILFNKNPIRQQVDALYTRSPGLPQFEYLDRAHLKMMDGSPDELTLREETGKRTYESQMAAQNYNMEKHKYVEEHSDDHYYWCEQAQVVRAGMDGLLGLDSVFVAE
jgi:hypothetical protein